MRILNFAHPLTEEQKLAIERRTGERIDQVIELRAQFDLARPFADQAAGLIDSLPVTPSEWQGVGWLVNPPAFAPIACTVLAELHGRMGYFPPIIRLRPAAERMPQVFELAEIISLQAVRERARQKR